MRLSLKSKRMRHVFGRFFFPHLITEDDLPPFHLQLIDMLSSPRSAAIIVPRGFAKTTWVRICLLHSIVYRKLPVAMLVGATQSDVTFHFDGLKHELEANEKLEAAYGSLVPQVGAPGTKWNSRHIRTTNGVNIVGRGAGKGRGVNIDGQRPWEIAVDDGETDEMVRSEQRREKYWRWITEVIEPSLDPDNGRLIKVGTILHPKAAVKRYYDERGGVLRKAIEGGRSIWPSRFPVAKLHRIRDGYVDETGKRILGIGRRAFQQEYMNSPVGDGLTMFPAALLEKYAWDRLPLREEMDVYMAVDPAAGEGSVADDYGLAVVGRHKVTGKRYALESSLYHGGIVGAQAWFHEAYERWQPTVAGIEAARTVQAFWQITQAKGKYRLRKLAPSMGIGGRAASKEERAKLLEPHVEAGMVLFDPSQRDLYDQMTAFPSADVKDDVFDAFMHANSLLDAGGATMTPTKHRSGTSGIRSKKF